MWYISDIVSDLASLFLVIEHIKEKYDIYDIEVEHTILIEPQGYKVAFKPYVHS